VKIKVHFLGILAKYFRADAVELDLPGTPTLKSLLAQVGNQYAGLLPSEIWDGDKKNFHPSLFIRGRERDLKNPEEPLLEDEEIYFLLPLAGG
jgi:molybdopterin converting factor small subunit